MTESTQACIRGCGLLRRHLGDCDGYDATGRDCRGCLPRRAEYGLLCWPCHRRFELMLHDAPIVDRWLTGNLASGDGAAQVKQDFERGKLDGSPAPIKVQVFDIRQVLRDRLFAWADDLAESRSLTGPKRHSVAADVKFIRTWLTTVESLEWIGDWWEELAETMRDAHALAPWRPEMKRCSGIPCPECEDVNLVIFGGESDVTCLSCKTVITQARYNIWTEALKFERMEQANAG